MVGKELLFIFGILGIFPAVECNEKKEKKKRKERKKITENCPCITTALSLLALYCMVGWMQSRDAVLTELHLKGPSKVLLILSPFLSEGTELNSPKFDFSF